MDDLVRWIGEQLDADTERATQWHDLECEIHTHLDTGPLAASRMLKEVSGAVCDCGAPARVLREIQAKRQLLAVHRPVHRRSTGSGGGTIEDCQICGHFPAQYPCATLRLLASVYADRPGFQEAWRP